jgi:hypothetical protein
MSTVKAVQHQVGNNATDSKNIVLTADVSTGDLVISKGVYDGSLTEISRILNAGGFQSVKQVYPGTPAGTQQTASGLLAGSGVPTGGNNGDFYFRSDGGAGTSIYMKRAGAWVGIV